MNPAPAPPLILDISRLLSRAAAPAPTGIDRVELAYATTLLAQSAHRLEFVALHPFGRFGTLEMPLAARFIAAVAARWHTGAKNNAATLGHLLRLRLLLPRTRRRVPGGAYLLLSHHHLTRPSLIAATLQANGARFVPMVQDLIPTFYPEYARPAEPARHRRRLRTVMLHADAVLVPSTAVRDLVQPLLGAVGRGHLPVHVIPHGVDPHAVATPAAAAPPYFVCLGTIEPRKNHLLLLHIWRRLAEAHGSATPRLILIGRRGWENENVVDMIERCPALQGVVEEHSALPDTDVARLLRGARALLFPSFAEGYGLPLAEALAFGTPVICSDIPVFHEVAGTAATYLDPLDSPAWQQAIEAFTANPPPRRFLPVAQPTWPESINQALCCLGLA